MALLAGKQYDPGTAASASTASLLAMTALDTTNLRVTFTAPASGNVQVRIRCAVTGATTEPRIHLGVLDGATVKLRMTPMGQRINGLATELVSQEVTGVVTGLTPGNSYTWDAAYGVDIVLASTNIKYGGPDDASGGDAFGAFVFEVWDAANLLAGTLYDPSTSASKVTTSLLAMTAFDTTNLRLTFTAPSSGNVWWRIHAQMTGAGAVVGSPLLGVLESTTVVGRAAPVQGEPQSFLAASAIALEASGYAAVSAGSHTWDAAYAVQVVGGAGEGIKYGGPNDTTTNNAFGGIAFEVWTA